MVVQCHSTVTGKTRHPANIRPSTSLPPWWNSMPTYKITSTITNPFLSSARIPIIRCRPRSRGWVPNQKSKKSTFNLLFEVGSANSGDLTSWWGIAAHIRDNRTGWCEEWFSRTSFLDYYVERKSRSFFLAFILKIFLSFYLRVIPMLEEYINTHVIFVVTGCK